MMDIEEMIKKWDERIALHRRVCDDPLMYTKEERLKNSHYAQAICAVVADLKKTTTKYKDSCGLNNENLL